jgi:hypothetical protein
MAAAHLALVFLATSWTRVQSVAPYQENSFNGGIVTILAFKICFNSNNHSVFTIIESRSARPAASGAVRGERCSNSC